MKPRWKRCQPILVFNTGHCLTNSHLDYPTFDAIKREIWLRSTSKVSSLPFCQQPVVFLPPPRRPSISPSPPKVVGQPGSPAGGEDEEEEGAGGGGGKVDEEGVEGGRQAPHLKREMIRMRWM